MARLIGLIALILLSTGGKCFAQHANPWDWQKDQSKCALYDGGSSSRYHTDRFFVNPPANTELIYTGEKKRYRDYAGHMALSYRALYRLTQKQYRILHRGLQRQYNSRGIKAVDVHSFIEMQLRLMLSSEKYEHWQRIKIYPEYDPYYLEWGRPIRDRSYSLY